MNCYENDLLLKVKNILKSGNIENYEQEAKWIIATAEDIEKATEMALRRSKHEPLQYILGEWDFYDITLKVGEGCLIPRPETEILIELVLKYAEKKENLRIIDLCSGSGCIAFTLEKHLKNAEIFALEYSENALLWLQKNKVFLNSNVQIIKADVFSTPNLGKFDIITCNPPYLSEEDMKHIEKELTFEPVMALNGYDNPDGLRYYREISKIWQNSLSGKIFFEIGEGGGTGASFTSQKNTAAEKIKIILQNENYKNIEIFKDLSNNERVITADK